MRGSTLAAAAIAAGLAIAAPATNAMPVATPGQLGFAEGAAGALEKTVLVCDPWTCYWRPGPYPYPSPYWGWRRHYWWGWHRPWWGWRRW
jgi:hypothetical protein